MLTFGKFTYHSTIDSRFEANLTAGHFTSIGKGLIIYGRPNHQTISHPEAVSNYPFRVLFKEDYFESAYSKGPIVIGHDVWIGEDVTILDGITIGNGAIIGVGAIVSKNIPPYAVAVGSPIVIKRYRFTPEQIEALEKIQWWNWSEETIRLRMQDMKDINVFTKKYL